MKVPSSYRPKIVHDDFEGDLKSSNEQKSYGRDKNIKFRLITHRQILSETKHICDNIFIRMDTNCLNVFVCLMKGGAIFFSYFLNQLDEVNVFRKKIAVDYLRIKTYKGQTRESESSIIVNENDFINVRETNVFVIDEIVDSGSSMIKAVEWLKSKKPKSITTITLMMKRSGINDDFCPDYCAFEIPNHWVVGFGCDINGHYRYLKDVYVLSEEGKQLEPF